jgi:hypothetical protein
MKNGNKIAENSVKIGGWYSLLVMTRGNIFSVQGAFPNMVIHAHLNEKWQ